MSDWLDIILLIIGMLAAFSLGYYINAGYQQLITTAINTQYQNMVWRLTDVMNETFQLIYYPEKNFTFRLIAEDLAKEHDYIDGYKCLSFSEELRRRLEDAGYETCLITGRLNDNNNTLHAWVQVIVNIESVSGSIISPEEYSTDYKELRRECE